MKRRLAIILAGSLLLGACSARLGDLQIVSTKNVALNPKPIQSGVEGEDCANSFIIIPLGSIQPNIEEAMDRAMAKVPEGNLMTNVALYQDTLFTFIFNQTCLRVKGDVGVIQ